MSDYSGSNRRKNDIFDHDLLTRIDENVKTLKENFILHKENLVSHKEDDDKKFQKVHERIDPIERAYWRMTGILAILIILLKFLPLPWK